MAFSAALAAGADGIEGDLHLTSDGVIVLMHDDTLDRTTNCSGRIDNHTLAELASCNAGYPAIFGDKFGFVPIPLFEEVVALISQPQYDAFWVLDLKADLKLGKLIRPIVDKYNATSRVIMSCCKCYSGRPTPPPLVLPPALSRLTHPTIQIMAMQGHSIRLLTPCCT